MTSHTEGCQDQDVYQHDNIYRPTLNPLPRLLEVEVEVEVGL
jgi:hypothetical protein